MQKNNKKIVVFGAKSAKIGAKQGENGDKNAAILTNSGTP